MARALLNRSKIVLMDEATSNVDYATDEQITATIRQEFDQATLLVSKSCSTHSQSIAFNADTHPVLQSHIVYELSSPSTKSLSSIKVV